MNSDGNQAVRFVTSTRNGHGLPQAREALQAAAAADGCEDSVLLEDLDATWTSPKGKTTNETLPVGSGDTNVDESRPHGAVSPSSDDQSTASPIRSVGLSGVKLTKPGYYTLPTLEELETMANEDGRFVVEDFVIGRRVS